MMSCILMTAYLIFLGAVDSMFVSDLDDDDDSFYPYGREGGGEKMNIAILASIPVMWLILGIITGISCVLKVPKPSKQATEWWEFLLHSFVYFGVAALSACFITTSLEDAKDMGPFVNGAVGGVIGFIVTAVLGLIYAKLIKKAYGANPSGCSAIRVVYLILVVLIGVGCGGAVIGTQINKDKDAGSNFLKAIGIIAAIYILLALPLLIIAVCFLNFNTYKSEEAPPSGSKIGEGSVKQTKSRIGTPNSSSSKQTKSSMSVSKKMASQPQLKRTASQQSTGSGYYQQLMTGGNVPQVKSISQYGALLGPGGKGGPPPPAAHHPPPPPPAEVKKTSSQQSTGSGYYQQLMQGGNAPQVKSISQYGALLGGGPK